MIPSMSMDRITKETKESKRYFPEVGLKGFTPWQQLLTNIQRNKFGTDTCRLRISLKNLKRLLRVI